MRYILDKNNSALVCNDNSDNICQRYILYILNKHPSGNYCRKKKLFFQNYMTNIVKIDEIREEL